MTRVLRYGSLIGGVVLGLVCCAEQAPTPSALLRPPTITQPSPQPPTPPPGELVATYVFSSSLNYPVSGFTTESQFLFHDNGVFGLRYAAFSHVYRGTYQRDNARQRHHRLPVRWRGNRDGDTQRGPAGSPLQRTDAACGLRERRLPTIPVMSRLPDPDAFLRRQIELVARLDVEGAIPGIDIPHDSVDALLGRAVGIGEQPFAQRPFA